MDVTCERCGTEYEFDETLLSGRGTSVKCTNCGHVFRVYPNVDRTTSNWRVRRRDGTIEVIETLKELQDRIGEGALKPEDEISRGGEAWKSLGTIAELESFFAAGATATESSTPVTAGDGKGTLLGAAAVPSVQTTLPPAEPMAPASHTVKHAKPIPPTRKGNTLPPPAPSEVPPDDASPSAEAGAVPQPRQASSPAPSPYLDEDDEIPPLPRRRSHRGAWVALGIAAVIAIVVGAQWGSIAPRLGLATPDMPLNAKPAPPAPEPAPTPTPKAEPKPEPAPVARPEPTPEPAPTPTPTPKAEPKPAPQPDPVVRPEPAPARKRSAKPSALAYDEYDRQPKSAPAAEDTEAFVDGRPVGGDYNSFMKKGNAALEASSLERARIYFESALEAQPGSAEATNGLASVALKSGNATLAIRYLRAAARRGDPSAYFRMGKIYRSMGQEEQAVSAYYTYLKRQPGGAHASEARTAIKAIEPYAALPPDPNAPEESNDPANSEANETSDEPPSTADSSPSAPDADKTPANP